MKTTLDLLVSGGTAVATFSDKDGSFATYRTKSSTGVIFKDITNGPHTNPRKGPFGLACVMSRLYRPMLQLKNSFKKSPHHDQGSYYSDGYNNPTYKPVCEKGNLTSQVESENMSTSPRFPYGFPNIDHQTAGSLTTIEDCFDNLAPPTFGFRVRAMLVEDESCSTLKYRKSCADSMKLGRVVRCPPPRYSYIL